MMSIIKDLPDDILGVEARGKITGEDYENTLIPAAEEKLETHDSLKMLFILGDMDGFDLKAMWQDTRFGLRHWTQFSHIALVTDNEWVKNMTTMFTPFFPGEVRLFESGETDMAREWVVTAR